MRDASDQVGADRRHAALDQPVPRLHQRPRPLDEGSGSVEHQTVIAPAELKDVDPTNIDGTVSVGKVLLGPFPYRGQLDMTVAVILAVALSKCSAILSLSLTCAKELRG
jgi:hypothetical protein